ncbi:MULTISPECIES: hypothetical protein [unclassified Nocardia]|uniref:hypothetical protein n=1 Tax=unclassified Nocardia TaxID=2637762 RepID=UPI001CE3F37D|nr:MULTISPECIES: hypothetical protein [unclassified Nocardia]
MDPDDFAGLSRAEKVEFLNRKIEAVPARGVADRSTAPRRDVTRMVLPVPGALADLLPDGGLRRGVTVDYVGTMAMLVGLAAEVSRIGAAALVNMPSAGLLAAWEMGSPLGFRLAVINHPDPVALAGVIPVLLDGLDLVIVDVTGMRITPTQYRSLAARARLKECTLILCGDQARTSARLQVTAKVAGYGGLGRGTGYLRTIRIQVEVHGIGMPVRGTVELRPRPGGGIDWVSISAVEASKARSTGTRASAG